MVPKNSWQVATLPSGSGNCHDGPAVSAAGGVRRSVGGGAQGALSSPAALLYGVWMRRMRPLDPVTLEEAAVILGCTPSSVRRRVAEGRLSRRRKRYKYQGSGCQRSRTRSSTTHGWTADTLPGRPRDGCHGDSPWTDDGAPTGSSGLHLGRRNSRSQLERYGDLSEPNHFT